MNTCAICGRADCDDQTAHIPLVNSSGLVLVDTDNEPIVKRYRWYSTPDGRAATIVQSPDDPAIPAVLHMETLIMGMQRDDWELPIVYPGEWALGESGAAEIWDIDGRKWFAQTPGMAPFSVN